jgi:hypothetical protein
MEHAVENTKQAGHRSGGPAHVPIAGTGPTLHPLLQLQQQAGNQAVQELLRSALIRAKLSISQPDDPEEREADQVAERVMRSAAGFPISSPCSCSGGEEMCAECQQKNDATVARKPAGTVNGATSQHGIEHVLRSPGQPLDAATRGFFEPRFGISSRHSGKVPLAVFRRIGPEVYTHHHHVTQCQLLRFKELLEVFEYTHRL